MIFTQEQVDIIEAPLDTDMVVVSAAGSGKSSSIIGRIQHLQQHHTVPLSSMCYITYSKKLAQEFAERLERFEISGMFHAGTIDSLCWRLLSQYAQQNFSKFECEPAQIVYKMNAAIQTSPYCLDALREVKFVFLDEAQDLDETRFEILHAVCRGKRALIVGDPRQTIYQHLYEANPALMMELKPNAVIKHLTACFRLSPQLVNFVNSAFVFDGLPAMTSVQALNGANAKLVVMHARPSTYAICRQEVVDYLVTRVKGLLGQCLPDNIMMLSPSARGKSEKLLNAIRTGLEAVGVPVFFNHHEYDSGHQHVSHSKAGVYLGTVHSAKGAEAEHVFILNFYVGNGAFLPRLSDGAFNKDFKNLLYVACTRAKVSLEMLETCHYPQENERIPFLVNGCDDLDTLDIYKSKLGRAKKPEHLAVTGITQLLQHLKGPEIDCLQECVVTTAERFPSRNYSFQTPQIFLENNDTSVYGRFIEVVLVRKVAENAARGTRQATDKMVELLNKLRRMPLYLTEKEFRLLRDGVVDGIPHEKFQYSGQNAGAMHSFVTRCIAKSKKTSEQQIHDEVKIRLQSKGVYVFQNSDMFYKKLQQYWKHFDVVVDPLKNTSDIIGTLWTMILLQCFHESYLGFYWLRQNELTASHLLPVGAKSWNSYLAAATESMESAYQGQITAYQESVSWVKDDPEIPLTGAVDLLTDNDEVIDIKCNMSEVSVTSLINRAQVQAYRGMLNASMKHSFLFSALSLTCYVIHPAEDVCVLETLDKFRNSK